MDSSWSVERLEVVGGLVGRQADRQTIVLGYSYVHMCISFTFTGICTHLFVSMCFFCIFEAQTFGWAGPGWIVGMDKLLI